MYYKNGQVFNSIQAIRNDMKETSLPNIVTDEMLLEFGYKVVVEAEKPAVTEVQYVVASDVVEINGVPTQTWNVVDMFRDTTEYTDFEGVVHPAKTKAEYEAEYLAQLARANVPEKITPRQARLVLLKYALLDDIEAIIAADRELGIWWEYSLDIKRDDPRLIASATALNITPEQLDRMFIEASVM